MKICWLHNYPDRTMGMFMWDVLDALRDVKDLTIEEQSVPLVRHFRDVLSVWSKRRSLGSGATLVHAQYGSLIGYLARISGRPYLLSCRGSDIYPHPGGWGAWLGGEARRLMSYFAARRAQAIVVMSHAMRARIMRWPGVRGQNIHVLVDPVSALFWPEEDRALATLMVRERLTVIIASRLENNPVKRLELVQQAQILCRSIGLEIELRQMVALDREAVRDAISQGDVLALASTHEGWPNVVKEALLLGKPFVATDVSDLADFAARFRGSSIVAPTAVDFAFAFIDLLASKVCTATDNAVDLVGFHPDVAAFKHRILYQAYGALR